MIKYSPDSVFLRLRTGGILLLAAALFAGCRKEEITVYRVPKENPAPPAPTASHAAVGHEEGGRKLPGLRWTLPAGWEEQGSGGMSVASFLIRGQEGKRAEVSVLPFPGEGASDLRMMVNIVREKAGLQPISAEDLSRSVESVVIGEASAKLVDLTGATTAGDEHAQSRIIIAVLPHDGTTWFFKLAGDGALVSMQKASFVDFLKSVTFEHEAGSALQPNRIAEASGQQTPAAGRDPAVKPSWEMPSGWQELPPSEGLLAKFTVSDSEGKIEITVTAFPGNAGGLTANVNRWRGQVGLASLAAADAEKQASSLDVLGGKAMLVDMTGDREGRKTRLAAVIVPREGQTWFYKLMGDAALAEREKAAFIKFVQSARYPNA